MYESNLAQNVGELRDQLVALGVDVSARTLQRWARKGLIRHRNRYEAKAEAKEVSLYGLRKL